MLPARFMQVNATYGPVEVIGGGITLGVGGQIRFRNIDGKGAGPGGEPGEPAEDPLRELNPCEKKLALKLALALGTSGAAIIAGILFATRGIAEKLERDATHGGTSDNNWINAVKHCVWHCELTKAIGQEGAHAFGVAHECDPKGNPQNSPGSKMDLHNNAAGQFYGSKFPKQDCLTNCKTDSHHLLQPTP